MDLAREAILLVKEEEFSLPEKNAIVDVMEAKLRQRQKKVADEWFQVIPASINRRLFEEKRKDFEEETLRRWILYVFEKMEENPEYKKPFEILIPEKEWSTNLSIKALCKISKVKGGTIGDRVHKGLEFAQKISNGVSWKKVLDADTRWYTIIKWNEEVWKIVGGATEEAHNASAVEVYEYGYKIEDTLNSNVVPYTIRYN